MKNLFLIFLNTKYLNKNIFNNILIKNFRCFSCNFHKSFYSIFLLKKINFYLFQTTFYYNLDTSIIIKSQNTFDSLIFYNPLSTLNQNENYLINNCCFYKCNSNSNCAGIFIQNSQSKVNIVKTSFIQLSNFCEGCYGASSIYSDSSNIINLKENCFINCQSSHGASFGLHTYYNSFIINNVNINYTLESKIGYNNRISNHGSFSGGLLSFNYNNNNNSNCISNTAFFILSIPNSIKSLQYSIISNNIFHYLICHFHYYNNNILYNLNFLNNTIKNSYMYSNGKSFICEKCIFFNNSININWINSIITTLNQCNFSNNLNSILFQSSILNLCNFNIEYFINSISFINYPLCNFNPNIFFFNFKKNYLLIFLKIYLIKN